MKTFVTLATSVLLSISVLANAGTDTHSESKETTTETVVKTVQLTGTVMDSKNSEMLVGAAISIDGKKYYSDLDGNFSVSGVKPGKHQIKIELISYQTAVVEVDAIQNESIAINLQQN